MFYVYDPDGLRFKGPMEALERERRVERRSAVPPLKRGSRSEPYPEEAAGSLAVQAYRQATKKENMVEPLVHIYQIMTSPVTTIHSEMPLLQAWRQMTDVAIRQLVVASERNEVQGILADRDILRRINVIDNEVEILLPLTVRDVMQEEVITTHSLSDIRRVARVMAFYHVDAMPVMGEEDRLVGIVTRGDILRGFAENPKLNLWA